MGRYMKPDPDTRELNFSKDTPPGFTFRTNVQPAGSQFITYEDPDVYIADLIFQYGAENVVVTEPAYDESGKPWDGRAVHVRTRALPRYIKKG